MQDTERLERARRIELSAKRAERIIAAIFFGTVLAVLVGAIK